ncbi:MAG: flavin monoamine oxidase family protein [Rubripirellula sp.]
MLSRRELLTAFLGSQVAHLAGCARPSLPPEGELIRTRFAMGHQIRDAVAIETPSDFQDVGVTIVGGGMAGLSAAWRLKQAGFEDFVLLELEDTVGGTARSGSRGRFQFPWGAHYIPAPMPHNQGLIQLFDEMGIVERVLDDGTPIIGEQFLCRDPEERVFYDGRWYEGLYPYEGASEQDLSQLGEFQQEINRWVDARDETGRRMFAVPMSTGSDCARVRELDQMSMAAWMDQHGWDSKRLRWLVDYSCRDDYGLTLDGVSAWAGVFYFAARVSQAGDDSQSVITWPAGNGQVVEHLVSRVENQVRPGVGVFRIHQPEGSLAAEVIGLDAKSGKSVGYRSDQVVFAAPQMLTKYVITGDQTPRDVSQFQYGSWLVANIHLRDRPHQNGFSMAWDNVLFGSKSLGYVASTHQSGADFGPTVLTWYYPFADVDPKITRNQMLALSWEEWVDLVLTDLRTAHPDIDDYVDRVDVMCWGHAMIQPRPGFIFDPSRIAAAEKAGAIHFAGTDLSGIALFEEAFFHGVRAAEEVMDARDYAYRPLGLSPRT